MNQEWSRESLKHLLNRSLEQIDQPTLARLHAARALALSRHEARTATLPLFAWTGVPAIQHASGHNHKIFHWIGAMLLAASILNGIAYYWQEAMDNDASDVDIAILTDEEPIQYFLQ